MKFREPLLIEKTKKKKKKDLQETEQINELELVDKILNHVY